MWPYLSGGTISMSDAVLKQWNNITFGFHQNYIQEVMAECQQLLRKNHLYSSEAPILLIAPQDFHPQTLKEIAYENYKWIQLSTAGYDFFPLTLVPQETTVTRCVSSYSAPICNYIMRELFVWFAERGLKGLKIFILGNGPISKRLQAIFDLLEVEYVIYQTTETNIAKRLVRSFESIHKCHAIVNLLPLNSGTYGVLDRSLLSRLCADTVIINPSRGEHVDQRALEEKLSQGQLKASLDTTTPDPLPADHLLRTLSNCRVSDHVAWKSGQREHYFLDDFIANYNKFLRTEPLDGVINE
ncbi:NAD(P)-dependent oxidoreductase [Vibrio vulnificus]|uniref:NAD(P)-dependent oxidoreductase n=1 Tax=Vibrio vulnificus TaxID=672 RepID=UPI003241C81B